MNDTDPIARTSGSPICTPTPLGASGEMRNAPLDTSGPSQEMLDLLRELRKTGEWSYILQKWSDQIDRELVAVGLVERREVRLGWIKVAYRAAKAPKLASGADERPAPAREDTEGKAC